MKTRARPSEGGYVLTGAKMWITNSPIADVMIVWAKDDADEIRGFILERGMACAITAVASPNPDVPRKCRRLIEPRLYQLIRQPMPIMDRTFEIEFMESGVEAFAFTFG